MLLKLLKELSSIPDSCDLGPSLTMASLSSGSFFCLLRLKARPLFLNFPGIMSVFRGNELWIWSFLLFGRKIMASWSLSPDLTVGKTHLLESDEYPDSLALGSMVELVFLPLPPITLSEKLMFYCC